MTFEEKVLPAGSSIAEGPGATTARCTTTRTAVRSYRRPDKPGKIISTEYDMIYVQEGDRA